MSVSSVTSTATTLTTQNARNATSGPGRDEFLTLFIASMKNQDPLNPMEATDMTAQLAQFSSLEQLTKLNDSLGALQAMAARSEHLAQTSLAVSMIGKSVVALGNAVRVDDSGKSSVTVHVGSGGGEATLKVFDKNGKEILSRSLGAVQEGEHTFDWDSTGLEPGVYSYRVEVVRDGVVVPVQEYTIARVDEVHFDAFGIILSSGASLFIPLTDVLTILQ